VEIVLRSISKEVINYTSPKQRIILYGDFHVLNQLYRDCIVLNDSILIYPDSTAVFILLRLLKKMNSNKIVSTDLQEDILSEAIHQGKKLFFFGDSEEVLSKLKKRLHDKRNFNFTVHKGYDIVKDEIIKRINEYEPDILFVGLGAGRQERWILENYLFLNVPVIISVGGWFQYLAGIKKRAPLFMRELHLEWIYKLISQFPRVWKRYLFGIPLLFYRVITRKILIRYEDEDFIFQ
jgi:N-acetylglucosaminyldiphosphoundecaprenol N-acetyl-beta-D-mannosaminyltransferase